MENDEEEEMRSVENSLDDESAVDESAAVDDSALFGEQDQDNDDFFQDVSSEVCFRHVRNFVNFLKTR